MRGWEPTRPVLDLIANQLALLDITPGSITSELRSGSFLVLFDGISEVPSDLFRRCCSEIANFIATYRKNRYVLALRTSEFSANLFQLDEVNPPLEPPSVYEIRRLSREQVEQYVHAYFLRHSTSATDFRARLLMDNAEAWESSSSSIQLARIPLFLQLFLDVYRKTRQLPESKAELLRALINSIYDREESRGGGFSDSRTGDRLLGSLAVNAASTGNDLTISSAFARRRLSKSLVELKAESIVSPDETVVDVWRRILSSNLLKEVGDRAVVWLHQLIRDCFLGFEYARMWETGDDQDVITEIQRAGLRLDMTYSMAIFALSEVQASELLWTLVKSYDGNGKQAFESQSHTTRREIAEKLVSRIVESGDYESRDFLTLAQDLPYREMVEAFDSQFHEAEDTRVRALLIEALAEVIIFHHPKVSGDQNFNSWAYSSHLQAARVESTKASIRRSTELLRRYARNDDDLVSFYAAKGLYEHERSLSVDRLRELLSSRNADVRSRVLDLIDEWGMR